ncbi:MAG: DUF192 domain-containing protein [Gemmatimonadota bacterium]
MRRIDVRNATRQSVLGGRVAVAGTHWTRLRGMLGRPEPAPGEGLLIVPCKGIHMYGMKYALDVVFLDQEGTVVDLRPELAPGTRTGFIKGSHYALEIPTGTIEASGTRVGDKLVWQPVAAERVLAEVAPEPSDASRAQASSQEHVLSP